MVHWTTNDLNRTTSVSSLLHKLNWQTLEQRRSVTRLCLFFIIVYGLVTVPLSHYIRPVVRSSRCNSMNFRQLHTSEDYYKYSFFPLAIVQWREPDKTSRDKTSHAIFLHPGRNIPQRFATPDKTSHAVFVTLDITSHAIFVTPDITSHAIFATPSLNMVLSLRDLSHSRPQ